MERTEKGGEDGGTEKGGEDWGWTEKGGEDGGDREGRRGWGRDREGRRGWGDREGRRGGRGGGGAEEGSKIISCKKYIKIPRIFCSIAEFELTCTTCHGSKPTAMKREFGCLYIVCPPIQGTTGGRSG